MAICDFSILVLPGAFASGVAVTLDVLNAAAALAPRLKLPLPRWRVLSPAGGLISLSSGLLLASAALPARTRGEGSVWVIPGLGVDRPADLAARLASPDAQLALRALRRHAAQGGALAASCSAVFLLQAAGVLHGKTVTTSWWLAPELRRLEPCCVVQAERMVCADGRISTAGAAMAQADLMLHLLSSRFGPALADAVAKVLLLDARQAQAPFVVPALLANGSALVRRLTAHIEALLPEPPSVVALAAQFAMSPRSLSRHVRAATGQGVLALVQSVRLNRARVLIESSRLGIEQVAQQVGYGDASALRRLMHKAAGAPPSRFRAAAHRA